MDMGEEERGCSASGVILSPYGLDPRSFLPPSLAVTTVTSCAKGEVAVDHEQPVDGRFGHGKRDRAGERQKQIAVGTHSLPWLLFAIIITPRHVRQKIEQSLGLLLCVFE